MFCKGLLIGWVFRLEPAIGVVGFGIGVKFRVTGKGEVDGVDYSTFGKVVATVFVIFFEETRDTCESLVGVVTTDLKCTYLVGLVVSI